MRLSASRGKIVYFTAAILILALLYAGCRRTEVPADFISLKPVEVASGSIDIRGDFVGGDCVFAGFSYEIYDQELRVIIYARPVGLVRRGSGTVSVHIEEDTARLKQISIQCKNKLYPIWNTPEQVRQEER